MRLNFICACIDIIHSDSVCFSLPAQLRFVNNEWAQMKVLINMTSSYIALENMPPLLMRYERYIINQVNSNYQKTGLLHTNVTNLSSSQNNLQTLCFILCQSHCILLENQITGLEQQQKRTLHLRNAIAAFSALWNTRIKCSIRIKSTWCESPGILNNIAQQFPQIDSNIEDV